MRIAALGECMVELSSSWPDSYALAFGGDTLNTSVYLARQGMNVDYVTALGDDHLSARMLTQWQDENIGTSLVMQVPGRMPGLYMIECNAAGERSFFYWRDRAPARELFQRADEALMEKLSQYDWLYFSGISLSLYGDEGRARLLDLIKATKANGGRIAFDGNYRPRGWDNAAAARKAYETVLPFVDIAFPTLDDEQMLYADTDAKTCAARLRSFGIDEVIVKQGAEGCLISVWHDSHHIPALANIKPVDTTAAGDSFNAAYLAARLTGASATQAAREGHKLAAAVICHRGAILPKEAMP